MKSNSNYECIQLESPELGNVRAIGFINNNHYNFLKFDLINCSIFL